MMKKVWLHGRGVELYQSHFLDKAETLSWVRRGAIVMGRVYIFSNGRSGFVSMLEYGRSPIDVQLKTRKEP